MIPFKELHLQLMGDPFYGFPPQAPAEKRETGDRGMGGRGAETATTLRHTNSRTLVEKIYDDLAGFTQAGQFRSEFAWKFFKDDIHRELIYLWCAFLGLAAYRDDEPLDWTWRDYIRHWDADFAFKNDELREFLRSQKLPLPAYFYRVEPDTTTTIRHLAIAPPPGMGAGGQPTRRSKQKAETARKSQQWQARLNELAGVPEHRGKSHKALCDIVAGELIAEGHPATTIVRQTVSPRNFVK